VEELKTAPSDCLQGNSFYLAISQLHKISTESSTDKINKLIYMPEIQSWFLSPGPVEIKSGPFIIPGLTGISLVGGVPKDIIGSGRYDYGYESYVSESDSLLFNNSSTEELCQYLNYINLQDKEIILLNKDLFIVDTINCRK
jgi:hypothetical protein